MKGKYDILIGVKDESDMTHLAIGELLLEIHPELLKSCTRGFDVVARYSDVSESTPRI